MRLALPLVAFEEARFRWGGAFHRDRGHLLADREHL